MTGSEVLGAAMLLLFVALAIRVIIKRFVAVVGLLVMVFIYLGVSRAYGTITANFALLGIVAVSVVLSIFFRGSSTSSGLYIAPPEVRSLPTREEEFLEQQRMERLDKQVRAEADERDRLANESWERMRNQ